MLLQKWLLTVNQAGRSPLANSGLLYQFGYNFYGQIGNNSTVDDASPIQIGNRSWAQIVAGANHTLALRSDSYLFTWGENDVGQLGDQTTVHRSSPVQLGGGVWNYITTKNNTSYGIRNDGKLYAWGQSANGELGIDNFATTSLTKSWSSIATGDSHTIAIRSDGLLFSWGNNVNGQLGIGVVGHRSSQVQVGTSSWVYISAGNGNSFAIRKDGLLFGWGINTSGQLGDGTVITKSSPVQITSNSWVQVQSGQWQIGGVTSNGLMFSWGTGTSGQLGDGSVGIHRSRPIQITSLATESDIENYAGTLGINPYPVSWTNVYTGTASASLFSISTDGSIVGWGDNTYGQLGINNVLPVSSPVVVSAESWLQVAINGSTSASSLAIKYDSTLWAWGDNSVGQLGDNTIISKSSPVQIGADSWIGTGKGQGASFGIKNNGSLWAWGSGTSGQLGNNSTVTTSSPVLISSSSWTLVTGGWTNSSYAIRKDGILFAWGLNSVGQLGTGSTVARSAPVQITSLVSDQDQLDYIATLESPITLTSWTQVSIGSSGSLGIRSDGMLFGWGDANVVNYSSPVMIGSSSWSQVSVGFRNFAAIRVDGSLFTWGFNGTGAIGDDTTLDRSSPVQIGTKSWIQVSAGENQLYAIDSSNLLWATGAAELGDNSNINKSSPVQIGTNSWASVSANKALTGGMAIRSDGLLFTWGKNAIGEIGQGISTVTRSSPVQVTSLGNQIDVENYAATISFTITGTSWTNVSSSNSNTLAIRSDGTLYAWGDNTFGQLGTNNTVSTSSPVPVGTSSWLSVSATDVATIALRSDGAIFTWGSSANGVLGDYSGVHRSSPVQIGTSSWTQVYASANGGALGTTSMFAIRSDNALFAWGLNNTGKLGTNDGITKSSPVQVGTSSWLAVSAGDGHTVAIRSDYGLFTWGQNANGQLGSVAIVNRSSPVQVGTSSWIAATAGAVSTAAIRLDRGLFTWGFNNLGQLGANSTVSRSSPVQVGTSSWTNVNAANSFMVALKSDNTIWSWGLGASGQLGDSTLINRSSPVQIGTSSWNLVSAGSTSRTSFAVDINYRLFAWGLGQFGQIGNYRLTDYSSPVSVNTINDSWSTVSSGASFKTAIRSDGKLFTWGLNTTGQLGDNTRIHRSQPIQVGNSNWQSVSAGDSITLARAPDSTLWAWGLSSIQPGVLNRSSPVQVSTGSWAIINAAYGQAAASIESDGSLYTWGTDALLIGMLGLVSVNSPNSPVLVKSVADTWNNVSAGDSYAAGVRSDGKLFVWGSNTAGRLGLNLPVATNISIPTLLDTSTWDSVAAGGSHGMALKTDGTLFTWGLNTNGQLGDGTNISRSSPVQIGTNLPDGYYSNLFNGTSSYLSVPNNPVFNFGSNSFTIEAWVKSSSYLGENVVVSLYGYTNNRRAWYFGVNASQLEFRTDNNGTGATTVNGATTLLPDVWYHIAAVKVGSSVSLYLNGVLDATGAASATVYNNTVDPVYIGAVGPNITGYYPGYISNLRILNGTALYTSNFTPPTTPLTNITNTVLLTAQSSTFKDNSSNNFAISPVLTNITTSSPFQATGDSKAWTNIAAGNLNSAAISGNKLYTWGFGDQGQLGSLRLNSVSSPVVVKGINDSWSLISSGNFHMAGIRSDKKLYAWGLGTSGQIGDSTSTTKSVPALVGNAALPQGYYSVSFNGTSNYLEIANSTNLILGTGDFTIEAWIYPTAFGQVRTIYSKHGSTVTAGSILFGTTTSGRLYLDYNNAAFLFGVSSITLNTWTHVAWSRSSGISYAFVNGNLDNSSVDTTNIYGTGASRIGLGRGGSTTSYWSGQISNLRVIKGTGLYTSSFTPVGPLTAITNTQLLTCQSSLIIDNSINNFTITNN